MILFPEHTDLGKAVDIIRPMMINRVLGNVPSLRRGIWDAASYKSKEQYWPGGKGPVPEDVERRIVKEMDLGAWGRSIYLLRSATVGLILQHTNSFLWLPLRSRFCHRSTNGNRKRPFQEHRRRSNTTKA